MQPSVNGNEDNDSAKYSTNIARGATYHEPTESTMSARLSRDVVAQSYMQTIDSKEASAVVQSGLIIDMPSNNSPEAATTVALDGFCPVDLSLHGRWTQGDQRWTVVQKGLIYRFSGDAQRLEFLSNPEKYMPVNGGFDPVVSVNENRNVPGQVNYCAAYKGRIYMFSSAATQETFQKNPEKYSSVTAK
jgi:YHS domain-containing protein